MQSFERKSKNTQSVKRAQQLQQTQQPVINEKTHNFKPIRQQKQQQRQDLQTKESKNKSHLREQQREITITNAQDACNYQTLSSNHKSPKTQFFSKQIQEELQALRDEINEVSYSGRNNYNQQSSDMASKRNASKERITCDNGVNLYTINKKKPNQVAKANQDLIEIDDQHKDAKSRTQRLDTKILVKDQKQEREDSKSRYSAVKSKVRSNLRSKTPKTNKRQILSRQQQMDQADKLSKREQEIVKLENEVFKNQNDLEFRTSNKDMMLDSYKGDQKLSLNPGKRKSTDPHLMLSSNDDIEGSESTDESTKVNLHSKRQFSEIEFQLRDTEFSDKYFDKVYLELCGFGDLKSAQQDMIENHKDSSRHKSYQSNLAFQSPRVMQGSQDIVGSITIIERRSDKIQQTQKQSLIESRQLQDSQLVEFDAYNIVRSPNKSSMQNSAIMSKKPEIKVDKCSDVSISQDNIEKKFELLSENQESSFGEYELGDYLYREKRNELRQQNQQMVEDFDRIFDELVAQRKTASHLAFYEAINEYDYDKKQLDQARFKDTDGNFIQAHSPTKRLICMKNSQHEHMKQIKDRNLLSNCKQNSTNMVYMASPERSYVVKSNEKIDYSLAYKKNPSKFYEQALNAPITKHKIQNQRDSVSPRGPQKSTLGSSSSKSQKSLGSNMKSNEKKVRKSTKDHEAYTIVSKTTTRPHNKINQKIKSKIEQKLADKLGSALTLQVLKALEEANIQDCLQEIISDQSKNAQSEQNAHKLNKGPQSHRSYQPEPLRTQMRQQIKINNNPHILEDAINNPRRMTQSYKDFSQIPQEPSSNKPQRERSASAHRVQRKKSQSHMSGTSSKQFASENYEDIAWERE